uniref:Uncharacterized protein n=1 Tax=Cannabis sativa TaxID=3483 RepID=A0A803NR60_CANSA
MMLHIRLRVIDLLAVWKEKMMLLVQWKREEWNKIFHQLLVLWWLMMEWCSLRSRLASPNEYLMLECMGYRKPRCSKCIADYCAQRVLLLMWNDDWDVTVKSYSTGHIDALVQCSGMRFLSMRGKKGGADRDVMAMRKFQKVLDDCMLDDLGYEGSSFTWVNKRQVRVCHGDFLRSDHRLIVAKLENVVVRSHERVKRRFRFESHWLKEDECRSIVLEAWQRCTIDVADPLGLRESLEYCANRPSTWNKQRFGSLSKQVVETQMEIDKLLNANALNERMDERSRSEWILASDRNTRYFHNKASVRKKKNAITEIMTETGQKLCVEEEIVGEVERSLKRTYDTSHLVERVLKQVQEWKANLLLSIEKACLIKYVGSAISNYVAFSDVITISIVNMIDKTLRGFWWRDLDGKRSMHTITWEKFCRLKAIMHTRSHLLKGLCWKIGNSRSTLIWFHPWVPNGNLQPLPRLDASVGVSLVSNFIHINYCKEDMVRLWFSHKDAKIILNITLPNHRAEDSWIWLPEPTAYMTQVFHSVLRLWKTPFISFGLAISLELFGLVVSGSLKPVALALQIEILGCHGSRLKLTGQGVRRLLEMENLHNLDGMSLSKWLPPPLGWIICNTDVAIGDRHSVGAAVFRNEDGKTTNIFTARLSYSDPFAGEIVALNGGAKTANNQGLYNAVLRKRNDINALHHNVQDLVAKFHSNAKHLSL